ncbi:MAG TPA: PQQ-binding-like beta-propeller repeat protein [Vicinamibacteria bacterium]|nr:PQQ-binding-like beta-propeller repeat protein [Vicinamibacteria bacterium]
MTPLPVQATSRPLRLRPAVIIATVAVLAWIVVPVVAPDAALFGLLAAVAGAVLILLWWLLFSRAPWAERLGMIAFLAAAVALTRLLVHESIRAGGMGMLFYILAVPVMSFVFVAALFVTRGRPEGQRRVAVAIAVLLACAAFTTVRTAGVGGQRMTDLHWRWTDTPEERLLAQGEEEPVPAPEATSPVPSPTASATTHPATPSPTTSPTPLPQTTAEWPGFRGPARNGIVEEAQVSTDWASSPPVQLWKRPVGPGWSSFAVAGDLLYTQEQRGPDELVAAYRVSTGRPVWRHRTRARFWESNAGAGPRGTPTLAHGRVYALGATGMVSALDARTGALAWARNAAADTGEETPTWGFSGSPLVTDGLVIVAASGRLVAYDAGSGERRWVGPAGGASYSSPLLASIHGTPQVLILSAAGLTAVDPSSGTLLWRHEWKGYPIVQPALTPEGDVLVSVNQDSGTRRLAIDKGPRGWTVVEKWTTRGLKPYFNDFVVHEGHAYGFDNNILACIELASGERRWKGGRYGNGQLVLLPGQDLLLVLSDVGELALVRAAPDAFAEVTRLATPALEGKTWNHPVLVRDVLLVRNDHEMAAFRVPGGGVATSSR